MCAHEIKNRFRRVPDEELFDISLFDKRYQYQSELVSLSRNDTDTKGLEKIAADFQLHEKELVASIPDVTNIFGIEEATPAEQGIATPIAPSVAAGNEKHATVTREMRDFKLPQPQPSKKNTQKCNQPKF